MGINNKTYTFSTYFGYKTLYTYFLENENGKISRESLDEHIGFSIKLGSYSYAEIPKNNFYAILGVSGTLSTLSETEKKVIENEYDIKFKTFMPSVYGRKNLIFNKKDDILIEKDENHFKVIAREIDNRIKGRNTGTKRAIFVVFENKGELNKFYDSDEFLPYKLNTNILSEEVNNNEKKKIVSSATFSGTITLFTRIFGRGTDFIVFDEIVSGNGGVHVIQTFLSEEISEEIQIMGRTARQGADGSYGIIIARSSLDKFDITEKELQEKSNDFYNLLNEKRNKFFQAMYAKNTKNVGSIRDKHYRSSELLDFISTNNVSKIKKFLLNELN